MRTIASIPALIASAGFCVAQDINLAVSVPLNYKGSQAIVQGATLATERLSLDSGQKLILNISDNECDPSKTLSIADRLGVQDNFFVIEGRCPNPTVNPNPVSSITPNVSLGDIIFDKPNALPYI